MPMTSVERREFYRKIQAMPGSSRGVAGEPWDEAELDILHARFADSSEAELVVLLPRRTYGAIRRMANKLGLRRSAEAEARNRSEAMKAARSPAVPGSMAGSVHPYVPWTEDEDRALSGFSGSVEDASRLLPGRLPYEIASRAHYLWMAFAPDPFRRGLDEEPPSRSFGRSGYRRKTEQGYVKVYLPGHPRADRRGYVPEHVAIWEEANGRRVPDGHVVHHDGVPKDENRPWKLVLMTNSEHLRLHANGRERSAESRKKMRDHALKRFSDKAACPAYVPVDIPAAVRILSGGSSWRDACAALGVSSGVLRRHLGEAAADGDRDAAEALSRYPARPGSVKGRRGGTCKPFDVDAAAALLDAGVPVLEACDRMGVCYNTFRKRLREAGIRY